MTRRIAIALMCAALAVLGGAPVALAHPGHEHKLLGTVTMAGADHVMLKDKDGNAQTVQLVADTKFVRGGKPMKLADVKVGMRIVVTAVTDENDDKLLAKVIELGPDPTAK
jgi:hypothetical protein